MRILLALAIFITVSTSAYAQNKITVVNPDGTKTSVDIGPSPLDTPAAPSADKPVNLRREPEVRVTAPAAPAKPVKKAAVKPPAKPETKSAAKPAKKPAAPKQAAKKAPVKKASAPKVPKKQAASDAAYVAPKPVPTKATAAPVTAQRLGPNMTSDDAIRIALDVAPPSRSVHAFPVNHNGIHAYQVVFATEDGDRSVFVDRETARIVK